MAVWGVCRHKNLGQALTGRLTPDTTTAVTEDGLIMGNCVRMKVEADCEIHEEGLRSEPRAIMNKISEVQ
jgi:hypothetical protein